MKFTKKSICGAVAGVAMATSGMLLSSQSAALDIDVSGSAAVASTYLWRGYDLGSGTPAVSGDLSASAAGAYVGIWGSSGDTSLGTEYDLYAGYGLELGMFTFDLSVWNYNYPTGPQDIDFTDLSEVIFTAGVGPVAFSYYNNIAGNSGYQYFTLSGEYESFSALIGLHDLPDCDDKCDPMHLDISYAYNENLSFTVSKFIQDAPDHDDLKFVVSYSLPIE